MPGLGSQLQNIGTAMAGFSAGLQGQLPQFQQVQQQKLQQEQQNAMLQQEQQAKMVEQRQKTMYTDAAAALQLTKMGRLDDVIKLGVNRLQGLQQFPDADPSDTQRVTQLAVAARNGDEEALELLTAELESAVSVGQAIGVLEAPKAAQGATDLGKLKQDLNAGLISQEQYDAAEKDLGAEEKFEVLTPEMIAENNLPADKQFQRNIATGQISQIGSGPAVQVNTGNATEGERTAGILANRLDFAQSQINDILANTPDAASPGAIPTMLNAVGFDYLARITNPAERQIIEAAQDDMLDAALTLGTGAAYTAGQFAAYKRSYFPQLGDDEETIEAKRTRLSNLLDAAYKKAGRGAPEVRRSGNAPSEDDPLGLLGP
jgi:hypothetical protein